MKIFFTVLVLTATISFLSAQEFILDNKCLVDEINETLDLIYNFEFNKAYQEIDKMQDLQKPPDPHHDNPLHHK